MTWAQNPLFPPLPSSFPGGPRRRFSRPHFSTLPPSLPIFMLCNSLPPSPFLASVSACSTLSPRDGGGGGVVALCTSPVRPFARKESCTHSLPGFPSPPPLLLLLLLLAATPSLLLLLRPLAVAALRRFLAVILAERERESSKSRPADRGREGRPQGGRTDGRTDGRRAGFLLLLLLPHSRQFGVGVIVLSAPVVAKGRGSEGGGGGKRLSPPGYRLARGERRKEEGWERGEKTGGREERDGVPRLERGREEERWAFLVEYEQEGEEDLVVVVAAASLPLLSYTAAFVQSAGSFPSPGPTKLLKLFPWNG